MLYLHDGHIRGMGVDWHKLTDIVKEAVRIKAEGDCAFPLKPYLRFKDPVNRIIAMPAYAGEASAGPGSSGSPASRAITGTGCPGRITPLS
ncbi:hypothetical protein N6H14_09685 [Paenibacillus sp. CC-CFT747]|nr:hypothetical protein N6H14_09685 [Paenibacillus sp. CC-CFT747]